jgi:PEP-CTERM motif
MYKRAATAMVTLTLLMVVMAGAAQAYLTTIGTADISGVGTGFNLVYDNESPFGSIVWLDYTHSAATWSNQNTWASGLNALGSVTYHLNSGITMNWGGSIWRLPSTDNVSGLAVDYNAYAPASTSSEMAHLYYAEFSGNLANNVNFNNINQAPTYRYWSETLNANYTPNAWYTQLSNGYQTSAGVGITGYGMAVRSGVVATPEPSTYILLGISLGVVAYARRRMNVR